MRVSKGSAVKRFGLNHRTSQRERRLVKDRQMASWGQGSASEDGTDMIYDRKGGTTITTRHSARHHGSGNERGQSLEKDTANRQLGHITIAPPSPNLESSQGVEQRHTC